MCRTDGQMDHIWILRCRHGLLHVAESSVFFPSRFLHTASGQPTQDPSLVSFWCCLCANLVLLFASCVNASLIYTSCFASAPNLMPCIIIPVCKGPCIVLEILCGSLLKVNKFMSFYFDHGSNHHHNKANQFYSFNAA